MSLSEQEIIQAFTQIADKEFGKAPDAKYPQHIRFETYFKMFRQGVLYGQGGEALIKKRVLQEYPYGVTREV